MNPDSLRAQGPQGQRRAPGQRGGFNREEMQKNMEAYNNELKAILTPEQYEAYQKDEQQNRRQFNGPRRERPTQRQ
jgi:Spy/CpxP family protein refolding chaperone